MPRTPALTLTTSCASISSSAQTGYVRGGVTALASKKPYPVCADELIEAHQVVSVSAGVRGTQILIAPADYLRATGARVGPIAR